MLRVGAVTAPALSRVAEVSAPSEVNGLLELPWPLWCQLVAVEAKGRADEADAALLRRPELRLRWMRGLTQLALDVDGQIHDSRLRLEALTERGPGAAVAAARAETVVRQAGRARFKRSLLVRMTECKQLLDEGGVHPHVTVGGLLMTLGRLEELLAVDDADAALRVTRAALRTAALVEGRGAEA
ncbi:MAG: hypothetical protein JWP11_3691 [Frankiales bacterium]|nr:hypothetical protein [Frankiales bacterium]